MATKSDARSTSSAKDARKTTAGGAEVHMSATVRISSVSCASTRVAALGVAVGPFPTLVAVGVGSASAGVKDGTENMLYDGFVHDSKRAITSGAGVEAREGGRGWAGCEKGASQVAVRIVVSSEGRVRTGKVQVQVSQCGGERKFSRQKFPAKKKTPQQLIQRRRWQASPPLRSRQINTTYSFGWLLAGIYCPSSKTKYKPP